MKHAKILIVSFMLIMLALICNATISFVNYLHALTPNTLFNLDQVFESIKSVILLIFILLGVACIICALVCTPCR